MVHANELRIGNILHFYKPVTNQPHILVVKGIYYDDQIHNAWFIKNEQYADINEKGLSPIPLTPEWLERLGFEKAKEEDSNSYLSYSILKLDGVVARQEDGWYQMITDADGYYEQNVGVKLEFVHQLQTRYQSFTNEELEIKMP